MSQPGDLLTANSQWAAQVGTHDAQELSLPPPMLTPVPSPDFTQVLALYLGAANHTEHSTVLGPGLGPNITVSIAPSRHMGSSVRGPHLWQSVAGTHPLGTKEAAAVLPLGFPETHHGGKRAGGRSPCYTQLSKTRSYPPPKEGARVPGRPSPPTSIHLTQDKWIFSLSPEPLRIHVAQLPGLLHQGPLHPPFITTEKGASWARCWCSSRTQPHRALHHGHTEVLKEETGKAKTSTPGTLAMP
jgi:hypothetical protein